MHFFRKFDDANGNTLSDAQGRSFTWDFENRLTQVTVPQTGGGSNLVAFKYDPFGRRIQKAGPNGTTNFLYDGMNLLEEVDGSGNIAIRYTQDQQIDQPLAVLNSGASHYYSHDGIGSVTSLTSASGTIAQTYTYGSAGKLADSSGSLGNRVQYTGREFDSETDLYFYRARYYDGNVGRFISEDPIGVIADVNLYRYALNRPVNLIDPSGHSAEDPSERYVVGRITRAKKGYRAEIHSVSYGKRSAKPDVVAELEYNDRQWVFVNFHYPNSDHPDNESLVAILNRLRHGAQGRPK